MLHWRLIEKLINRLDCTISVIDYPLAPENNYKTTIDMVINSYKYILSNYTNDKLVLMGDSAGGGLALACVLKLKKEYALALPDKLILLSPWLDLTLTNPEIKLYEKNDVQLSYDFLKYCADKYANNEDKRNYELSPINSSLKGLPNAIVFYGSKELFVPDIEKFKVKAEAERVNIKFRKYEGMQHDWILFPIEESNMAISEICDFVESSSN
jgi:acetyl esterase/lipase